MTNYSLVSKTKGFTRVACHTWWFLVPLLVVSEIRAGAVIRSGSGATASAIQATVDQFRADLGSLNGNVAGSFLTGRREINWDGVPDGSAAPNNFPTDFFNVNSPRGVVFSTPGTGFQVSADNSNPTVTAVEFGNIDPNYPNFFAPFSPERLFTPLGSNVLDVTFFVPGTAIPASVRGFGVVFSDVDAANTTSIQVFDVDNNSLGTFFIPTAAGSQTFSFLGVFFDAGERIARARITCGSQVLAPGNLGSDLVVMDDFIYGEPVPFPDAIAIDSATDSLVRFNTRTPATLIDTYPITGLAAGENLIAIDFRPSTGELFGLVNNGAGTMRLVIVPITGGALTQVGSPFSLSGTNFGFDFNPTIDRIRVTNDADQNLSLNPDNAVPTAQTPLNPGDPTVVGSAYTNSVPGATTTTLFGIDSGTDALVLQAPPAAGTIANVGPLGVNTTGLVGFDIQGGTNTGYATLTLSGTSRLFTVDLDDGSARQISTGIGSGLAVRALSLIPQSPTNVAPIGVDLLAIGLSNNLVRFNSDTPGSTSLVVVTGLGSGETIHGIDVRPANQVLYALGITDGPGTNDSEGRIYTIDPDTGVATLVGSGPFASNLVDGANYGFDFNPATDRIRIVNTGDQNMRVNPNGGFLTQFDTPLDNPSGSETVSAVAYDRNDTNPATATTLYALNPSTNNLETIGSVNGTPQSANSGILNPVGPLGITLFNSVGGFDIHSQGHALAALRVGTSYGLYSIDLASGTAIFRGLIGNGSLTVRGLAVAPARATLANISTRLRVETGDNVLIGGFIVPGNQAKRVVIRAIGPSLPFSDKLANPTLELHGPNGLIESNDNWVDSLNKQAIIDTAIAPTNDLESAILATLSANNAGYTAIVRGVNNGTGIGLVEVYDLNRAVDSELANISTRGFVQTGDNVLIAGTIVLGPDTQRVIVRAIGPSLPIAGAMADPTLELRNANGDLVRANDNWRTGGQEAEIIATTIPPSNDLESALVETLSGNGASFTAIVRGFNNTTGIALVEVYALP